MSIKDRCSCVKQQQLTTTWSIVMDAIEAITNHNGPNQRHHCEAPKRSQDKPLKRNEEGRGYQPQSHKAALPRNVTRALWGCYEYHNNTHPVTTIILTGASLLWRKHDGCKKETLYAGNLRHWENSCPRPPTTNKGSTTKPTKKELVSKTKETKPLWHICHASCATIAGQVANWVAWQSQWHRP